ncbi:phosphoenolpyruvate--protein phosphotransferase [Wenzhouxiangella marina]|uniref:Phosphoenolpyruvate-protein phosphotransferase n=1 Tax=Wenzhouxiangella marina TaxID=1579979 RepID=A0A0K0XYP0_9GAMM|nr:phosphoenolpyruvate--protein phosphotransferase [Wenzhouxiangella marina]AKS42790.1 Phosphoenolpyruvate-protein phosphotransferase [Wenzhouxiangella marina]MBB6087532.1 phosphotransferase system enzyme I (PtsI) [Wenzhouxiangella marina]
MSLILTGIGVTSGIAIGRVHRLTPGELDLPEYHLEAGAVENEIERLQHAIDRSERFIQRMLERVAEGGETARELLEAHRLILRDPLLVDAAVERIRDSRINAEWALVQQSEALLDEFRRLDDSYIALRREDLEQAVQLILRKMADQPATLVGAQVPHQLADTVIVADSLGPADMAILHQRRVAGLVTEHGGPMSHSAILARSLEIPMVVGIHQAVNRLNEDEAVILDGHYGALMVGFDEGLQRHYEDKREASERHRTELKRFLARPSRTLDGEGFQLYGNAELPAEFERCREARAAGIGLMRTEYLFLGDRLPDEDTQYRAYRAAIEAMEGRPVTIRTLDAGGDKLPPGLAVTQGPNPALGLRGLRLSLAVTELFREQIRAILRASVHGPVQILLPMLTDVEELHQARRIIDDCRRELQRRGESIDPGLPVGGMIETPAAALAVREFAPLLDFMSIGTNDLIQYVLAIDRQDEQVSYLYDPGHPAILSLIEQIVLAGREFDCPVTVCGELAGDEAAVRLLLALGVANFSMPPASIPAVKKSLIDARAARCREILARHRARPASGRQLLGELLRE